MGANPKENGQLRWYGAHRSATAPFPAARARARNNNVITLLISRRARVVRALGTPYSVLGPILGWAILLHARVDTIHRVRPLLIERYKLRV